MLLNLTFGSAGVLIFSTAEVLMFGTEGVLMFGTAEVLTFGTEGVLTFSTAEVLTFGTAGVLTFGCLLHFKYIPFKIHTVVALHSKCNGCFVEFFKLLY